MITLQKATLEDINIIRDIAEKTWFVTYGELLSIEQMDYMFKWMYSVESIKKQMTELGHVFFIAYLLDKPLGYVSVEQQDKDVTHLHKLYILPSGQKKGIGKILIQKAFDFARASSENASCAVELNVNRYNKAVLFYKKMGMRIIFEGDFDIGNGYLMTDYILRIDLEKD